MGQMGYRPYYVRMAHRTFVKVENPLGKNNNTIYFIQIHSSVDFWE
jgi:hypothetical protein